VSWAAPADNGGAAITGYRVWYRLESAATWTAVSPDRGVVTSTTVSGLANGSRYVFKVAAINAKGVGAESAVSTALLVATVPGAPTGVAASVSAGQATVSWAAPADNGGAAITGYRVRLSRNGGAWEAFQTVGNVASTTLTGLTNGATYVFQVLAVNAVGDGAISAASNAVLPQLATALTRISAIPAGKREVRVNYQVRLLDENGAPVVGQPVYFSEYWNYPTNTKVSRFVYNNNVSTTSRANWQPVMTDASGYATLKYTIPPNLSADNVRLLAEFGGSAAYKPASYSVNKISIG
jgi:hypothetical protein